MAPGWPAQTVAAAASGERMRLARQLQGRLRAALCSRCEVRRGRRVALTVHEEELHSQQAGDVGAGRGGVGTRGVPEKAGVAGVSNCRGDCRGREAAAHCAARVAPAPAPGCRRRRAWPSGCARAQTRRTYGRAGFAPLTFEHQWDSKPPLPSAQRRPAPPSAAPRMPPSPGQALGVGAETQRVEAVVPGELHVLEVGREVCRGAARAVIQAPPQGRRARPEPCAAA